MTGFAAAVGMLPGTEIPPLERVADAMTHRGPHVAHHAGSYGQAVQLRGHSASLTQDDELILVGDVCLDNRDALLDELGETDGTSDLELALSAFKRHGNDVCPLLKGDFAFIVIDYARRRAFCARDPFGAKPFYYSENGRRFACASEPAALMCLSDVPRRADLEQIALLLAGWYNEADRTVFDGVRSLPGGHSLTIAEGRSRLRRFWAPDPWRSLDVDLHTAVELVGNQVSRTLGGRLRKGGVAVYLSGGLDSAVVTGEVARLRQHDGGTRPTILHASFPGTDDDETRYSEAVAEMWDLPQINTRPLDEPDRLAPNLTRSPDVWWDPRLGMWEQLCEVTRDAGLSRGLTGDGVDECLSGTGSEWADDWSPRGILNAVRESGVARRPWSRSRWRLLLRGAVLARTPRMGARLVEDASILTPRFSSLLAQHRLDRITRHDNRAYPSLVARDMCTQFEEGDTNVVLASNERVGARAGIQIRDALMDVDLVELLLSLPHQYRHTVGLDKPKPVLRHAMKGVLPEEVFSRRTSGTYVNVMSQVLFKQPVNAVQTIFSSRSRLREAGIIGRAVAQQLRDEPARLPSGYGRARWSLQASSLVAMEILLRQL